MLHTPMNPKYFILILLIYPKTEIWYTLFQKLLHNIKKYASHFT